MQAYKMDESAVEIDEKQRKLDELSEKFASADFLVTMREYIKLKKELMRSCKQVESLS